MKSKKKTGSNPKYSLYQVQQAFVNALSVPTWITEKLELNPVYKYEHLVKRATRNAKCPKRTRLILSKPNPQRQYRKIEDGWQYRVRKAALKCQPTAWNTLSAIPRMQLSLYNKKTYSKVLKRKQKRVLNKNYNAAKNIFYQQHPPEEGKVHGIMAGAPIHIKCFDDVIQAKKAKVICQVPQKERKNFMLRMVRMAQPNPKRKPPKPDRGPKKPMRDFQKNLLKLAKPNESPDKIKINPYKVQESALHYKITDRTADLARHREAPPPPPVYDFRGREILPPRVWDIAARQKIVASARTCELAIPRRVKPKATVDSKDDPYAVSRAALKAIASERLIEISKPIIRD